MTDGDRWTGFRTRLQSLRVRAGLTQQDLAAKADVALRTLAGYESKKSPRPDLAIVEKLARVLECDPSWLIFGRSAEAPVPSAVESFIASNPQVTPDEAEDLRKTTWYHPNIEMTVGMVNEAWRELREQQRGEGGQLLKPQMRPGRKKISE